MVHLKITFRGKDSSVSTCRKNVFRKTGETHYSKMSAGKASSGCGTRDRKGHFRGGGGDSASEENRSVAG